MLRTQRPAYGGNYYAGRREAIRLGVVHTGETQEGSGPAEGMGVWFQNPAAKASAHKGVDTDSCCTYLPDTATAWAAPGANADGLHLELAGRAGQTASQWDDADSRKILANGARVMAEWCVKHSIPVRWLTDAQLAGGRERGLVTHAQVSRVFRLSTHTDPGSNFPRDRFLSLVKAEVRKIKGDTSGPVAPRPKPSGSPGTVAVDGLWGPQTIRALERWCGSPSRGTWTSWDVRALQRKLNATKGSGTTSLAVDGKLGGLTVKALQRLVGSPSDGVWPRDRYSHTTKAVQAYLKKVKA